MDGAIRRDGGIRRDDGRRRDGSGAGMLKLGWFSTGRGAGSRGLLRFVQDAIAEGRLAAQIEFVFCNREPGEAAGSDAFLGLARSYGLPLVTLSSRRYRREHGGGGMAQHRVGFDRVVMGRLEAYRPEVCVLAGYMLIFGPEMCRRYPLLNLHGALPDGPVGAWQSVIWQLMASGARETGAMVHLATEDVDRGPALSHCVVPIAGGDFDRDWAALAGRDIAEVRATEGEDNALFRRIRAEGYRREPYLLLATLQAVADGRLAVRPGEVRDEAGRALGERWPAGLPLTDEVETGLAADAGRTAG